MAISSIGDINFPRDTTLQSILEAQQTANEHLAVIAAANASAAMTDFYSIRKLVKAGQAQTVFSIGDQIFVNWTDTVSGTTYSMPFNVVSFEDVELKDGSTVPAMWLQMHYCSPFGVQFDQNEALYYCDEALPAGTYYFTIGSSWGTNCVSGSSYYFTTTEDIPAGGQIRIGVSNEATSWAAPDTAVANWKVWTYSSIDSTSALEGPLDLTEGTEGTSLGSTTTSIKYADSGINNLQRAGYGYNRWSQSGIRQYLNSNAAIGKWWTPQNNFDRPPAQLATYPGFMSGFEAEFLNMLQPIKVTTALNTISDSAIGTQEDTYDTFFLPSLEQMYITPQLAGVEGDYWPYWKEVTGSDTTIERQVTGAFPLTYAINAQSSAQYVRLRSANRGSASNAWFVYSSGNVGYSYASSAFRFAVACAIC